MRKRAIGLTGVFTVFLVVVFGGVPTVYAETSVRYGTDYENAVPTTTQTENIYYAQKADNARNITTLVPRYRDGEGLPQLCAVLSGACAIGYFDQYYENLIPNFTPSRTIFGKTIFTNSGEEIQTLIQDLYDAMGTSSSGTTYDGFKTGMTDYVSSHGYTFQSTEFGANHAGVRSWIDNEKPVAIFMQNGFHLIGDGEIVDNDTYDKYTIHNFLGNHVVLAFGYRTITYYNADGTVKENHRLYRVYTGVFEMEFGYIDIDRPLTFGGLLGLNVV